MRAFVLRLNGTEQTAQHALGAVACAPLRAADGTRLFDKGHSITGDDVSDLARLQDVELSLIVPEEGDLHEDDAATRLGNAAAGQGVVVAGPSIGRVRLLAAHRGLLRVDISALARMNSVGSVSVYTLFDSHPVNEGDAVAEAKVTPLVVSAADIDRASALAGAAPVRVLPFVPTVAAALIRERVSPAQARRVAEGLSHKLRWFGSSLKEVRYVAPEATPEEIAEALRDLAGSARLLFVSGGSAADPADPLLNAVELLGAPPLRIGTPAHPGSMLWLAYVGGAPLLGVPSCGAFSEATSLDLVLPTVLTGQPVTAETFAGMGHGGLLRGNDWRFPRYAG